MQIQTFKLSGTKFFVGFNTGGVGTPFYSSSSIAYGYAPLYGLWGGAEFNLKNNLALRLYANILYNPPLSSTYSNNSSSVFQYYLTANFDIMYRINPKYAVFVGIGLGDNYINNDIIGKNYFLTAYNLGLQYNINKNNLIEFETKIYSSYNFSNFSSTTSISSWTSSGISFKYAYRF